MAEGMPAWMQGVDDIGNRAIAAVGQGLDYLINGMIGKIGDTLDKWTAAARSAIVEGVKSMGESISQGVSTITERGSSLVRPSPGREIERSIDLPTPTQEVSAPAIPATARAAVAASNISIGDMPSSSVDACELCSFSPTHVGQAQRQSVGLGI